MSPYHLATREAPAMAALVLATRVVTLLPYPAAGKTKEAVREAIRVSPRYFRLLEAWRWSGALWRAGVISAEIENQTAGAAMSSVYEDIRTDAALAPLRPLTRAAEELRLENELRYLDALSGDLLKGGPDPGMSVPVNSALERFARRHGFVLVRSAAASVAQRAESRLGVKAFSIGLPVLLQAGGQRLLALRTDLETPLRKLRAEIVSIVDRVHEGAAIDNVAALTAAAEKYRREFEEWTGTDVGHGDDETGKRVVARYVNVAGVVMPPDAVLRSSRAAVRAVGGYSAVARELGPGAQVSDGGRGALTLVVREMNIRPEP